MLYRKVVLVVLDGLRPDAVRPDLMPALTALGAQYWQAAHAVTIEPSVTVAALTSLATGVAPARHGLVAPNLGAFASLRGLHLLPHQLRQHRQQLTIVTTDLPPGQLIIARALLGIAGIGELVTGGEAPAQVATRAAHEVGRRENGLTVLYLNDCDQMGHAHGWMSPEYLKAAAELDQGVDRLVASIDMTDTLLIFTADHGGGGLVPDDHEGTHPFNLRIPLILAGPRLRDRTFSHRPAHLLDIPATILAALGIPVPATYEGRVLTEAFTTGVQAVA